jgi:hypothetical protein
VGIGSISVRKNASNRVAGTRLPFRKRFQSLSARVCPLALIVRGRRARRPLHGLLLLRLRLWLETPLLLPAMVAKLSAMPWIDEVKDASGV